MNVQSIQAVCLFQRFYQRSLQSNIQTPDPATKETLLCCGYWLWHGRWLWLPTLMFQDGGGRQYLISGFHNAHMVRWGFLGPVLPFGSQGSTIFILIMLSNWHTLSERRSVNVVVNRVPHCESSCIHKPHGFSPLSLGASQTP